MYPIHDLRLRRFTIVIHGNCLETVGSRKTSPELLGVQSDDLYKYVSKNFELKELNKRTYSSSSLNFPQAPLSLEVSERMYLASEMQLQTVQQHNRSTWSRGNAYEAEHLLRDVSQCRGGWLDELNYEGWHKRPKREKGRGIC